MERDAQIIRYEHVEQTDRQTDRQTWDYSSHLEREVESDDKREGDRLKDALFVDDMVDLLLLVNLHTRTALIQNNRRYHT